MKNELIFLNLALGTTTTIIYNVISVAEDAVLLGSAVGGLFHLLLCISIQWREFLLH